MTSEVPGAAIVRHRAVEPVAVIALLLLFLVACLRFAWTTSPVFDEPGLVYAGYSDLMPGSLKQPTGNVILPRAWSALPLLAMNVAVPTRAEVAAVEPAKRELGRLFLFHPGNDWRAIIRASRAMIILLGLLLCLTVYWWSRRLFGAVGGIVSLALSCLSPLVIANSAVATTDLAVSLAFLLAVNRWWALFHRVSVANLALGGVVLGLLLATKVSGLLFFPMAVVLLLARLAAGRPLIVAWPAREAREVRGAAPQLATSIAAGAVAAVAAAAVLWVVYAWPVAVFARDDINLSWDEAFRNRPGGVLSSIVTAMHSGGLLPDPYLFDVRLFEASSSLRRGYLLGDYSMRGWWYFFPVAMWYKTPIPAMLLIALGATAILWRGRRATTAQVPGVRGALDCYELTPLLVLAATYLAASFTATLNIGIRHVLPVYPTLFVIAGAAALPPFHRRWGRGLVAALLLWSAVEVWRISPEFLAYFNQLGGGPENGHRVLVDSSYEWGQDLPAVEAWLAARAARPGPKPPVYLSYFGNADLGRFDMDPVLLPQEYELRPVIAYPLTAGTYIISATMLHTVYGPVMGPWRPRYEEAYRELEQEMRRIAPQMADVDSLRALIQKEGAVQLGAKVRLWEALRFARLCAHLRQRPPDARIAYGMLVFELSQEELSKALDGPPAELKANFAIRGTEDLKPGALDILN